MCKKYLILDCETATIPLTDYITDNEILAKVDSVTQQKITTSKPLIYDLAWLICDRHNNVYKRENFIIPEIYYNERLFNTAYYANKKPIYDNAIAKGDINIAPFNKALEILVEDMKKVKFGCAYNAMFDFKTALPFTQKYLCNKDNEFYKQAQKESIIRKINKEKSDYKNPDYNKTVYEVNGYQFPIIDIWEEVIEKWLNCPKYKNWCIKNNEVGKTYFKTNAETVTKYFSKNLNFIESHTALADCEIEKDILLKCINRKAIEYKEKFSSFPMKLLGTVNDYKEGL